MASDLTESSSNRKVQKMEQLLNDSKEECMEVQSCKKLAKDFNRSSDRAGKPAVKWTEIQNWYEEQASSNETENLANDTEDVTQNDATETSGLPEESDSLANDAEDVTETEATETSGLPEERDLLANDTEDVTETEATETSGLPEERDLLSRLEFEALSSKDGAWYDVAKFLSYRTLSNGELEVLARYVGFGAGEDEWVNAKTAVRMRSIPLESSECDVVEVGDLVCCYQERENQARYYDAHVLAIERKWHDIRGCRCIFSIKYTGDNTEEKVGLRRLCCRPEKLMDLPDQ